MNVVVLLAAITAVVVTGPRWLRVAQREHYLSGSATRFAYRWWLRTTPLNVVLLVVASAAFVTVWFWTPAGFGCAAVEIVGPLGLSPRGRTSRLVWTRRLRTTTATAVAIDAAAIAVGSALGAGAATAACVATLQPLVVDIALAICSPFERLSMNRFVRRATTRLQFVAPTTIALTGSYGKTSTKVYARHLIAGSKATVATPASFNNTGGLARTINDHLADGTEVFIAEMGTYGPGEIASMCAWIKPAVGAIVNIGPVHLERMKSLDAIVAAKAEITRDVETVVLNVDAYGLAHLADDAVLRGRSVIRASARDRSADVAVVDGVAFLHGSELGVVPARAAPENVAVALALAIAVGVPPDQLRVRLGSLPHPEHRREVLTAASGVTVIDNTFSTNPASVQPSLATLAAHRQPGSRAVLVTPGMVELGVQQVHENTVLANAASAVATDVIVVGRTNRRALDRGLAGPPPNVLHMRTRDDAVQWVRTNLRAGDVVLYENDLPDHYP